MLPRKSECMKDRIKPTV